MPDVLASLCVARFPGARGFLKMGLDRAVLASTPGVRFWRLLGTGRGSDLTLGADLTRWARFVVWSSREDFERFEASEWRAREEAAAVESFTVLLRPVRWRGAWGGVEPFGEPASGALADGPVAVLTRGTIRPSRLSTFWRSAPLSQEALREHPGLVASVGLGEVPLLHQGTFSVWSSLEAMRSFAYGMEGHRAVIARTRTLDWYSEEMFVRFDPVWTRGTWDGRDPVEEAARRAELVR